MLGSGTNIARPPPAMGCRSRLGISNDVRERLIRGLVSRSEDLDEQTYQLLTTDPS